MVRIDSVVVGAVSTNCYFLINPSSGETLIVDPGDKAEQISGFLQRENLKPAAILLTHGHFDHILAADTLREQFGIPAYACEKERQVLGSLSMNLSGRLLRHHYTMEADRYCHDGEVLQLAGFTIHVLETPGHTPGGCCYYLPSEEVLFCGDTLFYESIGRTDFEGGSYEALVSSVREKLFVLPPQTVCYPGHGEKTTIGHEKEHNPYVR